MSSRLRRWIPLDNFVIAILAVVVLASVLPASGLAADVLEQATKVAIALLFFLYGARLSPAQAWAGLKNWKLHLAVLVFTFVLFPALGLCSQLLPDAALPHALRQGFLYLTLTPSTVQSSIAFCAIAGGDVAAAVVAASLSSLLGVFLTPALVMLLFGAHDVAISWASALDVVLQLLVPFLAGQAARRWIGEWVKAHARQLKFVDQGSILLVVYSAFSLGMTEGVWRRVRLADMAVLALDCTLLLALVLGCTALAGKALRLSYEERVVLLFCGSKKSLAAGLPIAGVLFGPGQLGLVSLPLMLFHQIQLLVCTVVAGRMGRKHHARTQVSPAG
ncbi:MAG: bile acid:sodium symporter family protein [Segniliparus sp.]|uniref:bile acid:sodium symporter family protein n=1 Tax=Segniliparus sp. TaxID=2804064 RepID=UPI003F408F30